MYDNQPCYPAETTSESRIFDKRVGKYAIGQKYKEPKYQYRLVDFRNERYRTDILLSHTKCNIDILPDGIKVSGDFTTNISTIPVMKDEIESITLIRGKEIIDTFYLSPMHLLSKLGVPNRISRHASILPSEYKISETKLVIKSKAHQLSLITHGSRYDKLLRSFKNLGYGDKLQAVRKPSTNLLNHTT